MCSLGTNCILLKTGLVIFYCTPKLVRISAQKAAVNFIVVRCEEETWWSCGRVVDCRAEVTGFSYQLELLARVLCSQTETRVPRR